MSVEEQFLGEEKFGIDGVLKWREAREIHWGAGKNRAQRQMSSPLEVGSDFCGIDLQWAVGKYS